MTSCNLLSSQWFNRRNPLTVTTGIAKLARLMSPDLPQYIEPARLADASEVLSGTLDTDDMPRLRAALNEPVAEIRFRLQFDRDERGFITISGEFSTDLVLRCQRCLEALAMSLEKTIGIGWAADRDALQRVPDDLEPLPADEPRIALARLLEEEVLLGLPMAPVHARQACPASGLLEELKSDKESPFSVLKDLKLKKH